ncbi:MAG: D-alanyl-D-alanine carboxypeptidase family protein [Acetobacterium sp.]|nr:D-alanyl-D-alanine carboxypeptidase family protein [Bacillota bacterium]MCG2729994.1 D-alanyl-D-alanine carboxypeptidase family protein [Acetobacterium sp.]
MGKIRSSNGLFSSFVKTVFLCMAFLLVIGPAFSGVKAEDNQSGIENAVNTSSNTMNQETISQTVVNSSLGCSYRTHVQNVGWQAYVNNSAMSGTEGQGLRLEGIEVKLDNVTGDVGIEYTTHVENIGWQNYVKNGAMSGTEGQSLRLEAIKIRLTGNDAKNYDVYYQVHAQNIGWLDWAKNDMSAGSEGFGLRLEGIRIVVVAKGDPAPGATDRPFVTTNIQYSYQTHIQNIGWQEWKKNGELSGTTEQNLRLEAIQIKDENPESNIGIEYQTHVQNIGWQGWKAAGEMSGTANQGLRLEGIQIQLTGANAELFDVYYEAYTEGFGWMPWVKNGESAGTEGLGLRLEGIRIIIQQKGVTVPSPTENELGSMAQLVNKNHNVSAEYVPADLVWVNLPSTRDTQLRADAAQHLIELFNGASAQGLTLYCCSGYRSYATQASLYQWNVDMYGVAGAELVSARPGMSEHQLGLAMDVTSATVDFDLVENFGLTAEGQFLRDHAHEYGFIIRYPQGKTNITGYAYEPWHLRYLGVEVATTIHNTGKTMEEFYGIY